MTGTPNLTPSVGSQRLDTFAHLNSEPPIDRMGRFELLNDAAGLVFRNSPRPLLARNSFPASDDDTPDGVSDGDKAFHPAYSMSDSHPSFEQVGRFELLNDVAGRKLRVFRNSPRRPLAGISSPASGGDASGGVSDSNDAAGLELKESPGLHLGERPSLVDDGSG